MKMNGSLARRISLVVGLMILVSSLVIGGSSYIIYRQDAIDLGAQRAVAIARSMAATISGSEMERILEDGETDDEWERYKTQADAIATSNGTAYLYVLDANYGAYSTYFVEGMTPNSVEEEFVFGDQEDIDVYDENLFLCLETAEATTSDAYDEGGFGMMVSGFAPIMNGTRVVGVVGADIDMNDIMVGVNSYALRIIILIIAAVLVFGVIAIFMMRRSIGAPIGVLQRAASKIAEGDLDVDVTVKSHDEIGKLAYAFNEMVTSTKSQVEVLQKIAKGDLTVAVQPRSAKDSMSFAMQDMTKGLSEMVSGVRLGTQQFLITSDQISQGAQNLAMGATEQSGTVVMLEDNITGIGDLAKQSAVMAEQASSAVDEVLRTAEKGSQQMEQMVSAVNRISDASQDIGKVIKNIDDIASQTNILALNAAVEAARAGEYGKGFAVVAEEVRNLAAKSAASAKETGALIDNSINAAALGVQIAGETMASFQEIVKGISDSGDAISQMAEMSLRQRTGLEDITGGIGQVSQVASQNAATAEQSAAASHELTNQSEQLDGLLANFRLNQRREEFAPM